MRMHHIVICGLFDSSIFFQTIIIILKIIIILMNGTVFVGLIVELWNIVHFSAPLHVNILAPELFF